MIEVGMNDDFKVKRFEYLEKHNKNLRYIVIMQEITAV